MTIATHPDPVAERFSAILLGLRLAMGDCWRARSIWGRVFPAISAALLNRVCGRLFRHAHRFADLAARVRAGTFRAAPPRPASDASSRREVHTETVATDAGEAFGPAGSPGAPTRRATREDLPHTLGWLAHRVPHGANFGVQMAHLLTNPEMQAIVDASPGLRRFLRRLCRSLGVEPPELMPRPAPAPPPSEPAPAAAARPRAPSASHAVAAAPFLSLLQAGVHAADYLHPDRESAAPLRPG